MMRLFAALAALCWASAVLLAATGPQGLTLADAISVVNVMAVFRFQEYAERHLPFWVWGNVALPWLIRPAWLVPASLGIICAGCAGSFAGKQTAKRR